MKYTVHVEYKSPFDNRISDYYHTDDKKDAINAYLEMVKHVTLMVDIDNVEKGFFNQVYLMNNDKNKIVALFNIRQAIDF